MLPILNSPVQKKKVYIETYGCSNNHAESQIMAGVLGREGHALAAIEDADTIIVNTCSVKSATENKTRYRIEELQRAYPEKKLVLAGCLVEAEPQVVRKIAPEASLLSTNHIDKVHLAVGNRTEFLGKKKTEKVGLPRIATNPVVDIIPISSGCLSVCTFCSTKLAKGNLFSFSEEKIIEEIKTAKVGGGYKQFWLTSQDCGCYGFEHGTNAARLMKNIIARVSGKYYLRLGMANPQHVKRFLQELTDAYRDEHVFKFIHIPVQSGSNSVLRAMRRGHTAEDYALIANAFRDAFPEITVWTDIIAGFPGETEDDFEKTVNLVRKTQPDFVNVSAYSARPGTKAASMEKVPSEVVKERTRALSEIVKKASLERNKLWVGWSGAALVNEFSGEKQNFIARNYAYKPIAVKGDFGLGQEVAVEIIDARPTCLIGAGC
ncbi:MAG: tRNA (N(6)-L-threonylcarbamoyladenosine(37)-C(2))-methylthiotransferase [Candidatus Aenigmarchaeota archaeon]|nr:tRNA (N(6)-L-threonylcarbamoyladenosine(37)-C(2))-methylthiotransferase [Candidatus Aenigmarchaeota archaeon]